MSENLSLIFKKFKSKKCSTPVCDLYSKSFYVYIHIKGKGNQNEIIFFNLSLKSHKNSRENKMPVRASIQEAKGESGMA